MKEVGLAECVDHATDLGELDETRFPVVEADIVGDLNENVGGFED